MFDRVDMNERHLLNAMSRENLALYARTHLRGPQEAPYNGKFLAAKHHIEWADLLNKQRRLLLLASRSSGKSWFFSFAYPIWCAERMPGGKGTIFNGSDDMAAYGLKRIREEIETNPALAHLQPKEGAMWNAHTLQFGTGFELSARGMLARSRGLHPHVIVVDDVLNDDTLISPDVRKQQIEYFYSAIQPMLEPGGQLVCVGTPFCVDDLYGEIRERGGYYLGEFPAIYKNGSYLWPERLTAEHLAREKASMGEMRFAREYLMQPVSDQSSLFPSRFFRSEGVEQPFVEFGADGRYYRQNHGIQSFYMGVDFAFSSEIGADYTVIFTVGVDKNANLWVCDIQRTKGMPYEQQKELIISVANRFQPQLVLCEANQAQRIFADELQRQTQLRVDKYVTTQEKHRLDKGIPSLRPLFESNKVRIPTKGGMHDLVETWRHEMNGISIVDGRIVTTTKHDDLALGFFFAVQAYRSCQGFTFFFDKRDGDDEVLEKEMALAKQEAEEDYLGLGLNKPQAQPKPENYSWLGLGPMPKAAPAGTGAIQERAVSLSEMFNF